jgi:putative acetyltransferase
MAKKTSSITVLIRAQEAEDWEGIAVLRSMPNVVYYTLQLPFVSRDVVRDKLENPLPGRHTLVALVDERIVGQLGLQVGTGRRAHTAALGMMVHDDYQGQGIGSALMQAALDQAEKWLNLSRIELEVYTDNQPALELYRKFGFEIEGTLRDYAYRDGRYVDTYLMARVRAAVSTE